MPVTAGKPGDMQILGGRGRHSAATDSDAVVSHYNIQPSFDIYADAPRTAIWAAWPGTSRRSSRTTAKDLPKGATVSLRGQVTTMNTAFSGLFFGLLGAVVLIYLLIVVNFQSWVDPFVIITALPAALGRHRLDAVRHRHASVGAGADRRDHVHGGGDRQLHPGGELRARTAGRQRRPRARRPWRRASPASARC